MTDATSTRSTFDTEAANLWHGELPQQVLSQPYLANDETELALVRDQVAAGIKMTAKRRIFLVIKRAIDIVVSAVALIVLFVPFLAISWKIKQESPGPAIFKQTRWGKDQTKIRIYKFRTMRHDTRDDSGIVQTTSNDSRITRLGAFLRKSNIDELPQLINVFRGEMSLIGPRCHPIGMLAAGKLYEDAVPGYELRHTVRPGITGLAQCNGYRGPTIDLEHAKTRVQFDLTYVRDLNLLLDIKIILKTIFKEIQGGTGS